MQTTRDLPVRPFLPQFDSQGNDITEQIKTFRIGAAKLKRDRLRVIVGSLLEIPSVSPDAPVEAAQHFGLFYREIGLVIENTLKPRKRITMGVYEVLCAESNMTDDTILREIQRNSEAGFQFFPDAHIVGFYRSDLRSVMACNSPAFA